VPWPGGCYGTSHHGLLQSQTSSVALISKNLINTIRPKEKTLCNDRKMSSSPTQEQLLETWNQQQARKAYLADYAKKRRESDDGKTKTRANSRAYYWNHREDILNKRHLGRSALTPSVPTPSSMT
jgi:hypothetical protein